MIKQILFNVLICAVISCSNNSRNNVITDSFKNRTILSNDLDNLYESIKQDFKTEKAAKLYVIATLLMKNKQIDSALIYMREAYKIEQNNKMLLKDFGIIFSHNIQLDSAKRYISKSILVDSTYAIALSYYGLILYTQDSDKLAIRYYDKAIRYDSNNGTFYLNKALAFQQLGYMDSCCKYLKISLRYNTFDSKDYIQDLIREYDCK